MKRLFLGIACAGFAFQNADAQSAPQTVIGSAGAFATFANGSMSWTLGEVMTETYAGSSNYFTQGFNQPDTMYLTVISEPATQNISVYPNPVINNLLIDLSLTSGNYLVEILNMQGQVIRKEIIPADQNQYGISFREFAAGVYLLNIINSESNTRSSYKINKTK